MVSTSILINNSSSLLSPTIFSSSSSSSVSSSETSTSSPLVSSPRIRFAPLPDPRRTSPGNADDNPTFPSDHSDSITHFVSKVITAHAGEYSPCIDAESISSSYQTIDTLGSSSIIFDSRPVSPTTPTPTKSAPKPFRSWKPQSFLKPFLKRTSSASLPASPLSSSTESIAKFTQSLFSRGSSRPGSENDGTWGVPLRAWKSAGPASSNKQPKPGSTLPTNRVQTTPLFRPSPRGRSKSSSVSSSVSGLSLPLSTNHVRKGTRMLNGRVYGARGNNENPFANARDEADPAFVEWGHGGMGSVRNGVGGEMWKRLQSENSSVMVGSVESETWGKNADDGDDGSGMGWVKRRREQREKQKMEEEEKHTVREGGLDKTKDQNLLKPAVVSREDSTATLTPPVEPGPVKSQPVPVPSSTPVSPASADKEAHFLRAVTIPAPHKHHTRTPSYSRTSSNSHVNISHSRTDSSPGVDHTLGAALSIALAGVQETPTSPVPINGQKGAQPAEIEVDDEESSSEEEREEGDEDEDEDNEEATRKTSLSAQVEKVSWHKDYGKDTSGGER